MKRVLFLSVCIIAGLSSCHKSISPEEKAQRARALDQAAQQQAVADFIASLSDAEKISQLFLVNVERSDSFSPVERTGALHGARGEGEPLVPGGCLLFSYNIAETPSALASYTASIRRWYAEHGRVPPYIAIDQEGGDVNRLRRITSTLVSQKKTADWFSPEKAQLLYSAQARQLRLLGIQMNLAPVVEAETPENTAFLGTRTFGSLDAVLAYGNAAVAAYESHNIATVLKHFPGNSNVDPHTGLPHISIAAGERELYFKPFRELLPQASAVLISHAIVEEKNAGAGDGAADAVPACFSSYWVTDVLRSDYGFSGLIFSDDIFMGALASNGYPPEIAAAAVIEAGIDCIMLSEKTFGAVAGVLLTKASQEPAFATKINAAVSRVIQYKIKTGLLSLVKAEPAAADTETLRKAQERSARNEPEPPLYTVEPAVDFDAGGFDSAAFEDAYNSGMEFYR